MPDVTMCPSTKCPKAAQCYYNEASGTKPSEYRQAWFMLNQQNSPTEDEACRYFCPRTPLMAAAHDGSEP